MNYYQILELDTYSSIEDINISYKKLSKKYHPDRGGDLVKMQKITEAYTTLTNDKEKYDSELKSKSFLSMNNIFSSPIKIYIPLEKFYQGDTIKHYYNNKEYDIVIPPRTKNKQIITVDNTKFTIISSNHSYLKIHNNKLILEINISVGEMICGFVRTYEYLDGNNISFVQPVGKVIRHDTKLLFPKFGLESNQPLYIYINLTHYPKNNFLDREIKEYKDLKEILGYSCDHTICNRSIDLSKLPVYEDEGNSCVQQ